MKRSELGFALIAKTKLDFLMTQYGFEIKQADDYYIRFESKRIIIEIYHERVSYEIYCCMGLKKYDNTIEINELLNHSGIYNIKTSFQASSKESIDFCIDQISDLLNLYLKDELNGNTNRILKIMKTNK